MSSALVTFPTISFRDPWVWIVVVVVLLVAAVWISPATFQNILSRFGNIGGLLYQILNQVWGVLCELTFIPWKFVDTTKAVFFSTTFGVLAFGTLHIFIDSPAVAESVASRIPTLLPWLLAVRKFLEEQKPWPDIILVVLAIVALWHTLIEFRHSLKREEVPEVLGDLVIEFHDLLRQTPNPSQADKDAYLLKLMSQTEQLLVGKSRRKIFISIMSEETAKDSNKNDVKTGYLKLAPIPANSQIDTTLRLRVVSQPAETKFHGEGAAGSAFFLQAPVYIPIVLFQVGIRLETVSRC